MRTNSRNMLLVGALVLCFVSCRKQTSPESAPEPPAPITSETPEEEMGLEGISSAKTEEVSIPSDFVILADVCPDIIQEIRYYSTYNFVGQRIPGYERPIAYLTRQAADSLKLVCDDLIEQGYRLKVFDAYRPQMAVDFFVRWGSDLEDQRMKDYFYPDCPKSELFHRGYIAHKSGHTRGSTLDLTLFDMKTEREVDMGGTYDFLGETSHYNYSHGLTRDQINHRRILREAMMRHGFKPIAVEWWHFTLRNEPYPNHYFTFPIR